jgi:hypothetical protein
MSISRQLLTIVLSGMVIFSVAVAEAKGPKGPKGNQGKRSSFSTGSSQGQGIQGGGWTTPPGWTQGVKGLGWADGAAWVRQWQKAGLANENLAARSSKKAVDSPIRLAG